jgi:signal transduction histidine kinase
VANASHELRTPLTAERILIQVTLADPEADAATLRAACGQVLALEMRTDRLIDALLTLATGERGIERREPCDLAAHAVQPLGEVAASRGRGIQLDAKLNPAPAEGDPRLVKSPIANLADNALCYNIPGGWAEISTVTRGGRAVVSVRTPARRYRLARSAVSSSRSSGRGLSRSSEPAGTGSASRSSRPSPTPMVPR